MSHLYCGWSSQDEPLVSSSEGSRVTVSDGRPLCLHVLALGRTQSYMRTHTHTHRGTLAKTTQQLQCRHDGGDAQPSL